MGNRAIERTPWRYLQEGTPKKGMFIVWANGDDGPVVSRIAWHEWLPYDEAKEVAELIASAPALLRQRDELLDALAAIILNGRSYGEREYPEATIGVLVDIALKAIAATKEAPHG